MTNEDADQLIAEFENISKQSALNGATGYMELHHIIKVIKRFADKPPFVLTTDDNKMYIDIRQHFSPLYKDYALLRIQEVGKDVESAEFGIGLNVSELLQLIDNCTKMLEFMNK